MCRCRVLHSTRYGVLSTPGGQHSGTLLRVLQRKDERTGKRVDVDLDLDRRRHRRHARRTGDRHQDLGVPFVSEI